MDSINIKIENCNNIKTGKLSIQKGKLNIKYGMNGTGKSTLAKAIDLYSSNKTLDDLKQFGSLDEEVPSLTLNEEMSNVKVFNEQFVDSMVFKESAVIDNAFDVFIKTPDYVEKRRELDNRLAKLKIDIGSQEQVIQLRKDISDFSGKLELNAAKTSVKNNTNYKAILKKSNMFNIPDKLKKYSSIISDEDLCINWIDWKSKGSTYDVKGICPYCSDDLNEMFEEEKTVFTETYKKSDAQNLKVMLDLFEKFHKYMVSDKFILIISCIKEEKEESAIKPILLTFMNEYNYLSEQLYKMSIFDSSVFRKTNIEDIDKILLEMKIEKAILNMFSGDLISEIVDLINDKIEELRKEAMDIRIAMGKLQSTLKKTVQSSQNDINEFLESAGIDYRVGLDLEESGQAVATLQYKNGKDLILVDKIRNHLSWGEKNAFSLVLFMFYAISQQAELVVLENPISSFDTNKKYAIIHRMFSKQSGSLPRSFYKKTVLMLTHDFEPIIDFCVVGKLPSEVLDVKFIKNNKGKLIERNIDCNQDVRPVIEELSNHIEDVSLGVVHRVAFLRKFYEHNGVGNNVDAYNVLSSLIHGREKCRYSNDELMPREEVNAGKLDIQKKIVDFDYEQLIKEVFNEDALVRLYFEEGKDYLKMQIFRALFEVNPMKEIKEEDVLVKFINESYHIENDYAYYLDMIKFETVPVYIIEAIDGYMKQNCKR